jgi:hypothetical protein
MSKPRRCARCGARGFNRNGADEYCASCGLDVTAPLTVPFGALHDLDRRLRMEWANERAMLLHFVKQVMLDEDSPWAREAALVLAECASPAMKPPPISLSESSDVTNESKDKPQI